MKLKVKTRNDFKILLFDMGIRTTDRMDLYTLETLYNEAKIDELENELDAIRDAEIEEAELVEERSSDPILRLTKRFSDNRHIFVLEESFKHHLMPEVIVPKGYETDLGSIPRPLWILVSPSEIGRSAIVHDWLTSSVDGVRHTKTPRIVADKFLRDAVREEVGKKTSMIVYFSVRLYANLFNRK